MALRAQILERNQALARANASAGVSRDRRRRRPATSFAGSLDERAAKRQRRARTAASDLSASYERGETIDIAKVMLARQQASVGFEATLQVRNKLLSAYKDIMSMPV